MPTEMHIEYQCCMLSKLHYIFIACGSDSETSPVIFTQQKDAFYSHFVFQGGNAFSIDAVRRVRIEFTFIPL